jgi:hypothetical protein
VGRLIVLLPVLAVALVAGCGGGGGGSTLSHDAFVKQANTICAHYNAKTAHLGVPTSFDDIVAYARKLQPIARDAVGRFKKLKPPAEDRANWEAFAKSGDKLIAAAEELEQAGKNKDSAELQRLLSEAHSRSAESKRIANAMGTPACANT